MGESTILAVSPRDAMERDDEDPPEPVFAPTDREDVASTFRLLARDLGLPYLDRIDVDPADADEEPPAAEVFGRAEAMLLGAAEASLLVVAPQPRGRALLEAFLAAHPSEIDRLVVATPSEIRRALIERWSAPLVRRAVRAVLDRRPEQSAAQAPRPRELLLVAVPIALWAASIFGLVPTLVAVWTAVFLAIGVFRALIADHRPRFDPAPPIGDADLPHYAVLVPIHREVEVVPELVAALERIDYPADRLEIRLVVEADDAETRRAAERSARGPIEVVVVPPCAPRTKPKALNFALATVRGELITVFDAEDRPDPGQLRLAAATFRAAPADLGVVQAALTIDHAEHDRPWLVRQFEIEYGMLFHGLLPWLAEHRLFLPLGGTSNHFRRAALDAVGGWDPHNVTEDADIAVRLARAGWRAGVIASTTAEEAPNRLAPWLAQRSRWIKGWLQTWFAHMRAPLRLHRELGIADAVAFHLVFAAQLISIYAFAPSLVVLGLQIAGLMPFGGDGGVDDDVLLLSQLIAHASGILGAWILAMQVSPRNARRFRTSDIVTMPFYWCLTSVAAVRATIELVRAPSAWNKTPHGRVARGTTTEVRDPLAHGRSARL